MLDTKEDVEALIKSKVGESRTLDYKAKLPTGSTDDKNSFIADVIAFANTDGGCIVYGVTELEDESGKPTGDPREAVGVEGNLDFEIRRLEQLVRDLIRPSIDPFPFTKLGSFALGPVVVAKIPKSTHGPHMSIAKASPFYGRGEQGNFPMTVDQIRRAFVAAKELPERVADFHRKRLEVIPVTPPVPLVNGSNLILHAIPTASIVGDAKLDIAAWSKRTIPPIYGGGGWTQRDNADGCIAFNHEGPERSRSYLQMFRSGIAESVLCLEVLKGNQIYVNWIEDEVVKHLQHLLPMMFVHGLPFPWTVSMTLIGVMNFTVPESMNPARNAARMKLSTYALSLPDAQFTEEKDTWNLTGIMRPTFDVLWQAVGMPRSLNYDLATGAWKARDWT